MSYELHFNGSERKCQAFSDFFYDSPLDDHQTIRNLARCGMRRGVSGFGNPRYSRLGSLRYTAKLTRVVKYPG
jgi:hypothetical protein